MILENSLGDFFSFIMQEIQIPYKAAAKPQHLRLMRPFLCNSYQFFCSYQTDPKTTMNFDVPFLFKVNVSMYFKCSTGLIILHLNSLFEVTKTSNSIQIQTIEMYESQLERFKHMSVCVS